MDSPEDNDGRLGDGLEAKERVYFQKVIHDLRLLPYADQIEAEADALFADIKYNLGRYVMLRKVDTLTESWNDIFQRYLKLYDFRFSKEDHIALIKMLYELITIPNLSTYPFMSFAVSLCLLLRKSDLIAPSELELPWRPLYELCKEAIGKTSCHVSLKRQLAHLRLTLEKLIHLAKPYFPANATQEILEELRPGICAFNFGVTRTTIKLLEWFLPVMMTPDRYEQGYKLWFDEFMILWKDSTMLSTPSSLLHLFTDLAFFNIGYIDWEPYVPLMFTKFVQNFSLPVNYKHTGNRSSMKLLPRCISLWIASTLGGNSSTQAYLDKLLKTIETYFHPANFGHWLKNLEELFAKLSKFVVVRLYRERYYKPKANKPRWKPPIPDSHKLTDADVDAFVNSMMPIVTIGVFNKRCPALFEALNYLAIIRPSIVIPIVLEKVYPSQGDQIEPHKQIIVFQCLITMARPMVQGSRHVEKDYAFHEGPMYVMPLLFLSLDGIDPNEQNKCLATFRLIQAYVSMIPIVDCSKSSAEMSEDERFVCEETSRFEDFVLQLMDKVFALIESSTFESVRLESTSSNVKNQSHSKIEMELNFLFLTLLRQSSHAIFMSALSKLRSYILESTLEIQVSGRLVGTLCEVFTQVNGSETLKALMPFIAERFHEFIDEDDVSKAEHLNNQVLYPLLLLSRLVLTQGDVLLPYEDTVLKVVDKAIHLKSVDGYELGCVLLTNTLQALASMLPLQVERNLDDPDYPYVKDWGETVKIKSIKFYIPGENEVAAMQRIFERYFLPAVAAIEEFIKTGNSLSKDDLERTLRIISYILKGCNGFLPVWKEPPLELRNTLVSQEFDLMLGIKGEIIMPDGSNIRHFLVQLMSNLQEVMLAKVEDNTKSFFQLQMVWQNILFGNLHVESGFKYLVNFSNPLHVVKDRLTGCKGWFVTYVLNRVYMLQCMRKQTSVYRLTETHRKVFLNLYKLSISHYPGVRIKGQEMILSSLLFYPDAHMVLLPEIVRVLQLDPTLHHEAFKGNLYLMARSSGDPLNLLVVPNWEFIKVLWPVLAASGSSEKPSIVRLKKAVCDSLRDFHPLNIKLEVPDSCVRVAENLWETGIKLTKPPPCKEDVDEGAVALRRIGENNLVIYNELMDGILKILLEKNKIWNDQMVSMNLIYCLLNEEVVAPVSVVRCLLNWMIHESIHERKTAIKLMVIVLKQLKKKHSKIKIENPSIADYESLPKPVKLGSRADNAWLQYNRESRPMSQAAWDEPRYVHEINVGYYAWPREIEVYAPYSEQPKFDRSNYTEQDLEVVRFFDEKQNVDKLVGYLSLEGCKVLKRFDDNQRLFFKGLFRNYGDAFLPHFLPHLRRLVAEKENSSQRCAAEIIAGLVQGSKHWSYDMVTAMWNELLPILRVAMSNLTGESIAHWQGCMVRICMRRDPNRLHWLLEFLLEEMPKEQTADASIVLFGRIMILQSAVVPIGWKSVELLRRTLSYLEGLMEQRIFRTVRDALVTTLNLIINENLALASAPEDEEPNVAKFMDKYYPKFQALIDKDEEVKVEKTSESAMEVESGETKDDDSAASSSSDKLSSDSNGVDVERENKIRLFKTVCTWVYCSLRTSSQQHLSNFYRLLPLMCQLENDDTDEELSKICTQSIAALAYALHQPDHIPPALDSVRLVCQSDSWSSRANCLEFLQVLVFHNMSLFLSNQDWIRQVQDIVMRGLEDDRIEVREKAAKLLGGLLHCTIITDQEVLLEEFKKKARTKLGKRKRVANSAEDSAATANSINAARVRHAGVLGMCAFIRAYPYDIPKHVPPIFECLSFHLNDPEPIPSTIHKTVNEFKRTHCDGWTGLQGLAERFTEEQFAVLQDLTVPPSYYA